MTINSNAANYNSFSSWELALAKEHHSSQKMSALLWKKIGTECEEERAKLHEEYGELRKEIAGTPSKAWQEATGLRIISGEEWEREFQLARQGMRSAHSFFNIPQVPDFNLADQNFSFNAATNTINIGIGSKIQMNGYCLEVLENSVVSRFYDGSVCEKGAPSAIALSSLLRGLGVDASWGYDEHTKQTVMNFLEKLGVDTSRPFFINGTQFEMRDDKLYTVGQTAKQDLSNDSNRQYSMGADLSAIVLMCPILRVRNNLLYYAIDEQHVLHAQRHGFRVIQFHYILHGSRFLHGVRLKLSSILCLILFFPDFE